MRLVPVRRHFFGRDPGSSGAVMLLLAVAGLVQGGWKAWVGGLVALPLGLGLLWVKRTGLFPMPGPPDPRLQRRRRKETGRERRDAGARRHDDG